jgi:tRNA threonylcarbamoyl adenosine modification protein YjeE
VIYRSNSEEDTVKIAEDIASRTKNGDAIALSGDLGSGKTFFARAFIKYLLPPEDREGITVISPTFNLVRIYDTPAFGIYHLDLYRIKKSEELYELDLETIFRNVSLIEWPTLIYRFRPRSLMINIEIRLWEDHRDFILE